MVIEYVAAAGVGLAFSSTNWIMAPLFAKLVNEVISYMKPGESKENLQKLVTHIIPQLKLTTKAAESSDNRVIFEKLVKELRSAFYDLREVLDLVEYERLEYLLTRKRKHDSIGDDAGPSNQIDNGEGSKRRLHEQGSSSLTSTICDDKGITIESSWQLSRSVKTRLEEVVKKVEKTSKHARRSIELELLTRSGSELRLKLKDQEEATTEYPRGHVYGRDEVCEKISTVLRVNKIDSKSDFSVIGICGIAGSGKTTLAQHVYQYEKGANNFELFMWIHISQNFNVRDIARDMLDQVSDPGDSCPQGTSLQVLRQNLKEKLSDKKFLLVLDDIWCENSQYLSKLLSPFEHGHAGSKILVTSRNKNAVYALGPGVEDTIIEIQDLNEKDFLDMFLDHALRRNRIDVILKETLKGIGAHIAKKLMGSPLAAVLVGGLLRKEMTVDNWRSVNDSPYLLEGIMGILFLCYQHLDEEARRCFAYCSIFPSRHCLERDELVKLWVAEGFIVATNAAQMEETAKKIFDELVSASFMKLGEKDPNKGEEHFLVHDLLHELAKQVAGSDYFKLEYGSKEKIPLDVRHLFVETCDGSVIKDIVELKNLCTLIVHTGDNDINSKKVFEEMFQNERLRKLRVLVFKTFCKDFFECPGSIGDLKYLRYLAFRTRSGCGISLPDAFTKLYHMQIVDFGDCWNLKLSTPEKMSRLINLRHLIMKGVQNFPNIGRLISLETLSSFMVQSEPGYGLDQLSDLNKLRDKLEILNLDDVKSKVEALKAKLADKEGLRELVLAWHPNDLLFFGYVDEQVIEVVQTDILEALRPPEHLEELEIRNYNGERYPDWMVGDHRYLKCLQQFVLQASRPLEAIPGSPFFANLLHLTIYMCNWTALPNNMVCLQMLRILYIDDCFNIQSLGEGELPGSLRYLYIRLCDVLTKSCKTCGSSDWKKIKDIPNKYIPHFSHEDWEYPHGNAHLYYANHGDDMEEDDEDSVEEDDEDNAAEDNGDGVGEDSEDNEGDENEDGAEEYNEDDAGGYNEDRERDENEDGEGEDNEDGAGEYNEDRERDENEDSEGEGNEDGTGEDNEDGERNENEDGEGKDNNEDGAGGENEHITTMLSNLDISD